MSFQIRLSRAARIAATVVVALVVGLFLSVAAGHKRTQATEISSIVRRKVVEALDLQHGVAGRRAPRQAALNVSEIAPVVLSRLRAAAAHHGVTVGQIAMIGHSSVAHGMGQAFSTLAGSSGAIGLRGVDVLATGSWTTLADLQAVFAALAAEPVRITSVDISAGFYRVVFTIYGR